MLYKYKNDMKWDKMNKINILKVKVSKKIMINILMFFFGETPIHLKILIYLAKSCELSE